MKKNLPSNDIQLWIINNYGMNFVNFCISIISSNKKNKMKKLLMSFLLIMGIGFVVSAQTTPVKEKASKEKMAIKEHVCTDACKKAGKCVMADGEKCKKACCSKDKKGIKEHACTDACKKAGKCVLKDGEKCKKACCSKDKKGMKAHVCTDACKKAGKCVMAHGEKGHVCTEACKKA